MSDQPIDAEAQQALDKLLEDTSSEAWKIYADTITKHGGTHGLGMKNRIRFVATAAFHLGEKLANERALAAFATAYSKSGTIIDPEVVDAELDEISRKALGTLGRLLAADDDGEPEGSVPGFLAAVTDLLAVLAGTRAAFGMAKTMTGRELVDQHWGPDVTTPECDDLRLHLLATHCNLAALGLSDREARRQHEWEHRGPGGLRNHPEDRYSWDGKTILLRVVDVDADEQVEILDAVKAHTDRIGREASRG